MVAFPLQLCLRVIILGYVYITYPFNVVVPKWTCVVLCVMDIKCVFNSPGLFLGTVSDFLLRDRA